MDRLPAVILCLCMACGDSGSSAPAPPSRVVAVAATEDDSREEPFCEAVLENRPQLQLPDLVEPLESARGDGQRKRWVNVWATWCEPCIEEMPRIVRWRADLEAEGYPVDLVFVSADESAELVERFQRAHEEVASTLRVAEPASLDAWAASVGLRAGATLPLHVLVDAEGRVGCSRGGAVSDDGYEALRRAVARL